VRNDRARRASKAFWQKKAAAHRFQRLEDQKGGISGAARRKPLQRNGQRGLNAAKVRPIPRLGAATGMEAEVMEPISAPPRR